MLGNTGSRARPVDQGGHASIVAKCDDAITDTAGAQRTEEHLVWLRAFEAQHGRPLRVLHVGNIANNAYLNAKFLRSVGIEAHVVSHDYQHVMATPEWEEVELLHGHGDDFLPRFSEIDLRGYRRPFWFFSGPLVACASEISMHWGERPPRIKAAALLLLNRLSGLTARLFGYLAGRAVYLLIVDPRLLLYKLWRRIRDSPGIDNPTHNFLWKPLHSLLGRLHSLLGRLQWLKHTLSRRLLSSTGATETRRFIAAYDKAFPQRRNRLTAEDIYPYMAVAHHFRDMFRHYDIVQSYATEPIHALLSGKRPYVAFEHGTLRDFTMGDDSLSRLTALGYRQSDHTFVTNGDCLDYAERLGIPSFSPIIHPIDVDQHRQNFGDAIGRLRTEIGGDVILFCPVRHDWKAKGTDVHLRALPLIKSRVSGQVKLVLIRWGEQLADSEALLESLGCGGDLVWQGSMCRISMIKHIRAADVVLDQMALPHFGSTAPQAISAETPVISSYVPESTGWIIPKPAPILPAFSPEEVADAVVQALDLGWRADYKRRARHWTDHYHCPNNVIRDHLSVYRRVLGYDRQGDRTQTPL